MYFPTGLVKPIKVCFFYERCLFFDKFSWRIIIVNENNKIFTRHVMSYCHKTRYELLHSQCTCSSVQDHLQICGKHQIHQRLFLLPYFSQNVRLSLLFQKKFFSRAPKNPWQYFCFFFFRIKINPRIIYGLIFFNRFTSIFSPLACLCKISKSMTCVFQNVYPYL